MENVKCTLFFYMNVYDGKMQKWRHGPVVAFLMDQTGISERKYRPQRDVIWFGL